MRWLVFLVLLLGCRPAPPCPDGCSEAGLAVLDAPDIHAPCPESKPCADYLAYAAAHGRPVEGLEETVSALHRAHEATDVAPPGTAAAPPLRGDALRSAIVQATALAPLLDGLDARPLELREVARRDAPFGTEVDYRVRDPEIGLVNLLLLRPRGDGPFPGVVALPGHGDSPAFHRDRYLGAALAEAGYATLIVQLRNHRGDAVESETTRHLLTAGVPLIGVRVYEALLAHKILRWHPDVIPDRIAAQGHSGGAEIAALLARVEPRIRALVIDHQSAFLGVQTDGRWLDDTCPALHRIHPSINDLTTSPTPTWQDAYEFPAGAAPVVRFLRQHVGHSPR